LVVVFFSSCYYFSGILVPAGRRELSFKITGYGSDLYPPWLGSRKFLLEHRDPYSDAVTKDIQQGVYGEGLPDSGLSETDEQRFAYPLFTSFLFIPVLRIPFGVLQPLASAALAVLTACSIVLWSKAMGISLRSGANLLRAGLMLVWIPVVQGIWLQQLGLLVCFLLAVTLYFIAAGRLVIAGAVLALAMIKPQLGLPLTLWLLLWVLGDFKHRYGFAVSGFVTALALAVSAQLLQPGWIGEWIGVLRQYRRYAHARSLVEILTGRNPGTAVLVTVVLWAAVAWLCFGLRKAEPRSVGFNAALCLSISAGVVTSLNWLVHNQVVLLPVGMFLLLSTPMSFSGIRRFLPLSCQYVLLWYAASVIIMVLAHLLGFRTEDHLVLSIPLVSLFFAPPFFFVASLASAMYVQRRSVVALV
jgi:hypothetical protein